MVDSRLRQVKNGCGRRAARQAIARAGRAEADIYEALRAELEEDAAARPMLLSLLSHDLRNSLGVLPTSLGLLGRALPQDHAGRRHVEMIRRAVEDLTRLLDTMSEASRIDRGLTRVNVGLHDARQLLADAVGAVGRDARDKKIVVTVAPDIKAVRCDRDKLVRVLSALTCRALRMTNKLGSVDVRAQHEGVGVRITIADNGVPIPARNLDAVFDIPRDDSAQRATGPCFVLDLFVARGVVEAHGGQVSVESAPGAGTAFHILLPDGG